MTSSCSDSTAACRCRQRKPASADGDQSVVRVKGSAGPLNGELEVTTSGAQEAPVSTAITILVLATAAALAVGAIGAVGWLVGLPAAVAGLSAYGAFVLTFISGLYVTFLRDRPGSRM
jgi:hypothetical protein